MPYYYTIVGASDIPVVLEEGLFPGDQLGMFSRDWGKRLHLWKSLENAFDASTFRSFTLEDEPEFLKVALPKEHDIHKEYGNQYYTQEYIPPEVIQLVTQEQFDSIWRKGGR